jgi:hypothetical protein
MGNFFLFISYRVTIHKGGIYGLTIYWVYNKIPSFAFQISKIWLVIQNRCLQVICMSYLCFLNFHIGQKLMKMAKSLNTTSLQNTKTFFTNIVAWGILQGHHELFYENFYFYKYCLGGRWWRHNYMCLVCRVQGSYSCRMFESTP